MTVQVLSPNDTLAYTDYINNHQHSTIYHTLEWQSVIEKTYGYKPFYLIKKKGNSISAALPLFLIKTLLKGTRLVALPFSHSVSPLYQDIYDLKALISYSITHLNQHKGTYLEIKDNLEFLQLNNQKDFSHFYNSTLDLSLGIDQIWKDFETKKVRWGINKAKKSPITIKKCHSLDDYLTFYQLELETRKRQGAPPYSKAFFKHLYHQLTKNSQAELYLAQHNNQAIAGIIMLYHGKTAIYGYGASVSDRKELSYQPNHLLIWQAIQNAQKKGCLTFDFGTTALNNSGLLRFKKGWGTQTEKITYSQFSCNDTFPVINRDSKSVIYVSKILKHLPIPVLSMVGPQILKQLG